MSTVIKEPLKFLDQDGDPDHHQDLIIFSLCHCQHFFGQFQQNPSTILKLVCKQVNVGHQLPGTCNFIQSMSFSSKLTIDSQYKMLF